MNRLNPNKTSQVSLINVLLVTWVISLMSNLFHVHLHRLGELSVKQGAAQKLRTISVRFEFAVS